MFGLIDGSNFYVSCERAFNPTLNGKPVIVLSNNDGCAIARSAEAKALGIKMGEVWHFSKRKPEYRDVIAKSSNYALYGDMSRRVFEVLSDHFARVEPYSIDEMFLDLTAFARVDYCRRVRERVRQITKIPTCVGIGPTKTLAKLANKHAKMATGVSDFSDIDTRREAFATMPIDEIWGVGRANQTKLNDLGIFTVEQFAKPRAQRQRRSWKSVRKKEFNRLHLARTMVDCHRPGMVSQTIPPTIPATVYIRSSSEAQTGRDSLRRQLEAAQRYADEHRLLIVETIIDEAVSAFSGHHLTKGRLGQFIRRVEDRAIAMPHVLICESLDRLNRQAPLDALAPFIGLINGGVTLVTLADRQRFTRESMGEDGGLRLLGSLIDMFRAHEESAIKSQRVRAAWERKRREADVRKLTKTCPAWLRLTPDRSRFEFVNERADIVRLIFNETALGVGKGSIAARLNDAGVPPFRGKNGWHATYIQKLLSSDAALGIYQPHTMEGGRRVPASHLLGLTEAAAELDVVRGQGSLALRRFPGRRRAP